MNAQGTEYIRYYIKVQRELERIMVLDEFNLVTKEELIESMKKLMYIDKKCQAIVIKRFNELTLDNVNEVYDKLDEELTPYLAGVIIDCSIFEPEDY